MRSSMRTPRGRTKVGEDASGRSGVDEDHRLAPCVPGAGTRDLVCISEVGYFLSPTELTGLVDRVHGSLTPDGVVVLCHWRHRIDGWVLDADRVRRAFTDDGRLPVRATYRDRDIEILLLGSDRVLPEPTA